MDQMVTKAKFSLTYVHQCICQREWLLTQTTEFARNQNFETRSKNLKCDEVGSRKSEAKDKEVEIKSYEKEDRPWKQKD